MKISRKRVQQI